jgi:hypothetical protein
VPRSIPMTLPMKSSLCGSPAGRPFKAPAMGGPSWLGRYPQGLLEDPTFDSDIGRCLRGRNGQSRNLAADEQYVTERRTRQLRIAIISIGDCVLPVPHSA